MKREVVCEVCQASSFSFIDGAMVCTRCQTVSQHYLEEGRDSGDDELVNNTGRKAARRKVESKVADEAEQPRISCTQLYQDVLREQVHVVAARFGLDLGDLSRIARELWFKWLEAGGMWTVIRHPQRTVLRIASVECTLWITLAACRVVGASLLASELVGLAVTQELPLSDPLAWLTRHRQWSSKEVPRIDNRDLLVLAPPLPGDADALMDHEHWRALYVNMASPIVLEKRLRKGMYELCDRCGVVPPRPTLKAMLRIAKGLVMPVVDEKERAVTRKTLATVARVALAWTPPPRAKYKEAVFPEAALASALAIMALKMVREPDEHSCAVRDMMDWLLREEQTFYGLVRHTLGPSVRALSSALEGMIGAEAGNGDDDVMMGDVADGDDEAVRLPVVGNVEGMAEQVRASQWPRPSPPSASPSSAKRGKRDANAAETFVGTYTVCEDEPAECSTFVRLAARVASRIACCSVDDSFRAVRIIEELMGIRSKQWCQLADTLHHVEQMELCDRKEVSSLQCVPLRALDTFSVDMDWQALTIKRFQRVAGMLTTRVVPAAKDAALRWRLQERVPQRRGRTGAVYARGKRQRPSVEESVVPSSQVPSSQVPSSQAPSSQVPSSSGLEMVLDFSDENE